MVDSMKDDIERVVEIRDPTIDSEALIRRICEGLRLHRVQAQEKGMNYEALVRGEPPCNGDTFFDYGLHYNLQRMKASYNKIEVELSLTQSRVPLLGPLIQSVRKELHQLVIYYTNRLAARQAGFNEYVVAAMTDLMRRIGEENQSLRHEISELQAQLEDLETNIQSQQN